MKISGLGFFFQFSGIYEHRSKMHVQMGLVALFAMGRFGVAWLRVL